MRRYFLFSACALWLFSLVFPATVILNSQDYGDIISAAAFAKHNNHSFVFSLTPNQSVFVSKYYTLDSNEPIIYLEGSKPVLANMRALLQSSPLKNLQVYSPPNVQFWIADQLSNKEAIIVGEKYGQDALSVSSYAALSGAPIFFIGEGEGLSSTLSQISSKGYSNVIIYGSISDQLSKEQIALFPKHRVINSGSRYTNNLEIAQEFLNLRPSEQVVFVSGHSFEKSMVDTQFPLILIGRSDVPTSINEFLRKNSVKTGIVFSGDGDIVEGVNRLKSQNPQMSFFVKFGEGYKGSTQPLPLMIVPLPSPRISLEVVNLTYNVPSKLFELRIKNTGDFAAVLASASISGAGSAQSSQITMDSGTTTTLAIPLEASALIKNGRIDGVEVTISYGQDTAILDNVDSILFSNVQTSFYNDTSSVKLTGAIYSSEEKAFILTFEGEGWVSGSIGFNINNRPVVLRIPLSKVEKISEVRIKHLLSSDEEKFVRGIDANYFLRIGQRSDILLKEARGQQQILLRQVQSPGGFSLEIGGLYVVAIILLVVGAFFAFKFFGGDGTDSFQ